MVALPKPLRQVLVDRRLADAEMPGSRTDGGAVFDDVHSQIAGPFLHEVLQSQHSLHIVLKQCMQG